MKNTRAPRHYLVYLPCKPYIKKFIRSRYGDEIRASLKHSLGAMINASLDKNIYNDRDFSASFVHTQFTDRLSIHLTEWQWSHIGFDFPPDKVAHINAFLEGLLKESLYAYCEAGVLFGQERYACIESFATRHNISFPEDISWEGLIKIEARYRQKQQSASAHVNKNIVRNCPVAV